MTDQSRIEVTREDLGMSNLDHITEEHWLPYVYGTMMLLLISAGLYFGVHGISDLQDLKKAKYNVIWSISQLGYEHQRLLHAVDSSKSFREIRLRGDIYLGCISDLQKAPVFGALRPNIDETRLEALYESARTTDRLIDGADASSGRIALASQLRSDAVEVRALTVDLANIAYNMEYEERLHRNWVFTSNFVVLESLMVLLILLSLFAYTIRKKLLDTNQIKLASAELSRRNLELELERAQAEDASRAKSQFLSNMSHEIRTPLTGIIGILQIIDFKTLTPDNRDLIGLIQRSSRTLLEIVNSILSISKIESEEVEVTVQAFDFRALVSDVLSHHELPAAEKGIDLLIDFDDSVPRTLESDPGKIEQILQNLLSNALKFTERGSVTLTITKGLIASTEFRGELQPSLLFEVIDTGIGIPEKDQGKIFRPFYQVDGSFKRRHTGTGLGLSITHKLVSILGGSVSLSSRPGSGTTFTVELPVKGVGATSYPRACEDRFLLLGRQYATIFRAGEALFQLGKSVVVLKGTEVVPDIRASAVPCSAAVVDYRLGHGATNVLTDIASRGTGWNLPTILVESPMSKPSAPMPESPMIDFAARIAGSFTTASLADVITKMGLAHGQLAAGEETGTSSREQRAFDALRVLVVDDNSINRRVLERLLRNAGVKAIQTANGGAEAVQKVRDGAFDLVLMDVQMPEVDGYAATRLIRSNGFGHLRIVACSAHAFESDLRRSMDEGMDGHLSKPVQISELLALLESLQAPRE